MNNRPITPFAALLLLLALPLLACSLPSIGVPSLPGISPTLVPSPTPPGDFITFRTLTYRESLAPGETIDGTNMRYVQRTADGSFEVQIDGLTAYKKAGDSFAWRGVIAPAVAGRYDLRITVTPNGEFIAVGPAEITVLNPTPVEIPQTPPAAAPLTFEELLIAYVVPAGGQLPGTTMTYVGQTEQGAQLTGTTGFPYYKALDSLTWQGQLRENVILRYDLRVTNVTDDNLFLLGTAKLWVYDR